MAVAGGPADGGREVEGGFPLTWAAICERVGTEGFRGPATRRSRAFRDGSRGAGAEWSLRTPVRSFPSLAPKVAAWSGMEFVEAANGGYENNNRIVGKM